MQSYTLPPASHAEYDNYEHKVEINKPHFVKKLQRAIINLINQYRTVIRAVILTIVFVAFTVYFAFAVRHSVDDAMILIVVTSLAAGYIVYKWIRNHFGRRIFRSVCAPVGRWWDRHWNVIKYFVYIGLILGVFLYLTIDVIQQTRQLQSLAGLVIFFALPWITSKHPQHIQWRPVIWGMVMQFVIGCLVLRWRFGYSAVQWLANQFSTFLSYSVQAGAKVFGDPVFLLHPFAMLVVPLIVYLGCVMSILYYIGFIPWLTVKLGWIMSISLHTTSIESVSLAVNIFLSVLDAVFMLKDYLPKLTDSEFHCFLIGAHSTIAGFAFGLFILFGVSPQHLLTGAVMSAPAAVALAKLNYPETEQSAFKTADDLVMTPGDEANFIDAGIRGAWTAAKGVGVILIQVIAFLSMFGFVDAAVSWMFQRVNIDMDIASMLGYCFVPLSFLMGVDWEDTQTVGRLIGLKVTANEFLAYIELGKLNSSGGLSRRSAAIATYAMCGFSSFGTLVIFSGVWQSVQPERTVQVLEQIPRIMMNANLSCFLTACIASILYSDDIEVEESNTGQLMTAGQLALGSTPDIAQIRSFFQYVINYR